jgi:hypothetical protein
MLTKLLSFSRHNIKLEQAYLDKGNGVKLIVTPTWKHIESKVSNPLVV